MAGQGKVWLVTCEGADVSWAFPFSTAEQAQDYVAGVIDTFESLPDGKAIKQTNGVLLLARIWSSPSLMQIISVDRSFVKYLLAKYDHRDYVETRRFSRWFNATSFVHSAADKLDYEVDKDEDSYGEWDFIDKEDDEDIRYKLFIAVYGQSDRDDHYIEECYAAIGAELDDSDDAVKKAYRKAVMHTHPDHGGSEQSFNRVQEAYTAIVADRQSGGRSAKAVVTRMYGCLDFKSLLIDVVNKIADHQDVEEKLQAESIAWMIVAVFIIGGFIAFLIYGISKGWEWVGVILAVSIVSIFREIRGY